MRLVLLCVLLTPAGAALAGTTWYVCSGITGADPGGWTGPDAAIAINASDANAGTDPAFPLRTLGPQGLQGRMADGDTAYISGRFFIPDATPAAYFWPDSCNHRTFSQWPGMPPAMIRGSNRVAASAWAPAGVAAYSATIGPGLGASLATVVFDYDLAENIAPVGDAAAAGLGRRTSHLAPDTEAAVLAAAGASGAGRFAYNPQTGVLTVVLPGGAHPATARAGGVEYAVRGRNAFYITSENNVDRVNRGNAFLGLRFALWADAGSGSPLGTPIAVSNGDQTLIEGCVFEDSGVHSYSFGSRCTDNVCRDNVHIGMAPSGIACVFNATGTTGGLANAASGCRIERDVVFANTFLAHDGSLAKRGSAGAFICHGPAVDVELENFRVVEYAPPGGAPPDSVAHFTIDDTPPPADAFDPATYAVRVRQTDPSIVTIADGTRWPNQGTTSAAFVNCAFRFPRSDEVQGDTVIDLRSVRGITGFFGCEFVADLGSPLNGQAMFAIGARSSIVTLNCSGYDASLAHGPFQYSIFRWNVPGGYVYDFQSAWGFRVATGGGTRQACSGDAVVGSAYHWFLDSAFWNVNTYSDNPAFNTAAKWTTVIDPVLGGQTLHLGENPFEDVSGASGLSPGPSLAGLQKILTTHAEKGVNGLAYDGRYGAYQFGGAVCPADFDGNTFVTGDDFDLFIAAFEAGDPSADINGDTFVSGEDFDEFIVHFEGGC